jgi:hypothetical protein
VIIFKNDGAPDERHPPEDHRENRNRIYPKMQKNSSFHRRLFV